MMKKIIFIWHEVKNLKKKFLDINNDEFKEYSDKHESANKNTLLKSYDLFLNDKYSVVLNQKTIERVKNYFQ